MKRSIDQRIRQRNFDVRHCKIETGAVIKNRKGLRDVEKGKKSYIYQWKEKGQFSNEINAVSDMKLKIVSQNRHRKSSNIVIFREVNIEYCACPDTFPLSFAVP